MSAKLGGQAWNTFITQLYCYWWQDLQNSQIWPKLETQIEWMLTQTQEKLIEDFMKSPTKMHKAKA